MTYLVKIGQNLIDIAIEVYGDPTKIYDLAKDNELDICSNLPAGLKLIIDDKKIVKPKIVKFFSDNNLTISTNGTNS